MSTAVSARGLRKAYGALTALDGLDLDVAAGTVHGLLGPNGAGKSTLLRLLLGLVRADAGTLEITGTLGGFVETPPSWSYLTGRQNLEVLAGLDDDPDDVAAVLDRVGLTDRADTRVAGWSLGMRQRLGIAGALLRRPSVLVLDEPGNGLDPLGARALRDLVRALAEDGLTVLLCSHDLTEVDLLCHEVTVVVAGRAVWTGAVTDLRARPGTSRLTTSDDAAALRAAPAHLLVRADESGLTLTGTTEQVDGLVLTLAAQGIAVRSLAREDVPLEVAFAELALAARR